MVLLLEHGLQWGSNQRRLSTICTKPLSEADAVVQRIVNAPSELGLSANLQHAGWLVSFPGNLHLHVTPADVYTSRPKKDAIVLSALIKLRADMAKPAILYINSGTEETEAITA